jgi:hypothetical protein
VCCCDGPLCACHSCPSCPSCDTLSLHLTAQPKPNAENNMRKRAAAIKINTHTHTHTRTNTHARARYTPQNTKDHCLYRRTLSLVQHIRTDSYHHQHSMSR